MLCVSGAASTAAAPRGVGPPWRPQQPRPTGPRRAHATTTAPAVRPPPCPAHPRARPAAAAAAAPEAAATASADGGEAAAHEGSLPPGVELPGARLQPALTGKQRAALRAEAESLAKAKSLQRLQVGGQGITRNVLLAAMDLLAKHEFLRVKLGEGCGLERKATAALLGELLDAAVVGQVGFTITLYRQRGLPRPDTLPARPQGEVPAARPPRGGRGP